jgi:hypothetical protein
MSELNSRSLAYKSSRVLTMEEIKEVKGAGPYPPKKVQDPVGSSAPYTSGGTDEWHGKQDLDPV